MTTLAAGQSATVSLKDGGVCAISSNGGLATVAITPTVGPVQTVQIGPLACRQSFGPYSEGSVLTIASQTAIVDYDQPGGNTAVATFDPVTGGIAISAGSASVGGNAAPYAFTSRALTDADNGMSLKCASAQVATVNTGRAVGFGCAFKGAVSFAGSATVTDVRTTGAANPWCALMNTGVDTYDAVGSKA